MRWSSESRSRGYSSPRNESRERKGETDLRERDRPKKESPSEEKTRMNEKMNEKGSNKRALVYRYSVIHDDAGGDRECEK